MNMKLLIRNVNIPPTRRRTSLSPTQTHFPPLTTSEKIHVICQIHCHRHNPRSKNLHTFVMLRTAHELNTWEEGDATRQQHGEAAHLHSAILTSERTSLIPPHERPAPGRVVDVIEQAALGHQQRVRLEWSFCVWTIWGEVWKAKKRCDEMSDLI